MFEKKTEVIYISALRQAEVDNTDWFEEDSPRGLAGRCLLDALEYLHSVQKFPARFWHVVNAHTVRLVHRCLSDKTVNRRDVLARMTPQIEETCRQLSKSRQSAVPYFGDDFWDWASVINAFAEVKDISQSAERAASDQLQAFYKAVQSRMPGSLSVGDPDREWYGPATAALAYRVLNRRLDDDTPGRDRVLSDLKRQALQRIENGKYFDHEIPSRHVLWHYGQVVAVFPEAEEQVTRLADFSWLQERVEKTERVYALARVLQGAYAVSNERVIGQTLEHLYKCQNLGRPLGQGLIGDTVKGSLNVLDALWPNLENNEKADLGAMIDALIYQYAKANTIGFQVAIPFEAETLESELRKNGAHVGQEINGAKKITHPKFHGVIRQGKSNAEATSAS